MRTAQGCFGNCIECLDPYKNTWIIKWNEREETNDREETITKWEEEVFDHKPTIDEIKTTIEGYYNTKVQEKILSGFTWEEETVWLSQENQLNYKSLYDLQNDINVVKVGDNNYITFNTFEEYKKFYLATVEFIKNALIENWKIKDNFDYSLYLKEE